MTILGDDYPTPDGTCIRDYIHVTDLADAHVRALERMVRLDRSDAINLGTGRGYSVSEVVEAARRTTGREIPTAIGPRRPGDPPALVARSDRARMDLVWEPRYPRRDITSILLGNGGRSETASSGLMARSAAVPTFTSFCP